MNKKLFTVTIGIPAHNEAQNIIHLLHSILKQENNLYNLKKILVVCDGSTDATASKVLSLSKKYPVIQLVDDGKRLGKPQRLNQMYQMNTSDILVNLDGDIMLGNTKVIDALVKPFYNPQIWLVTGNYQPIPAQNFIEKLINTQHRLWYEIRKDVNKGNSIHNSYGCVAALRDNLAKTITYPNDTISNSHYLYFSTLQQGGDFKFVKDAIVYYYSPNNVHDYLLQINRSVSEKAKNAHFFGKWVHEQYAIPKKYKLKGLFRMLFTEHIYTLLTILFHYYLNTFAKRKTPTRSKKALWQMVSSTKRDLKQVNLSGIRVNI